MSEEISGMSQPVPPTLQPVAGRVWFGYPAPGPKQVRRARQYLVLATVGVLLGVAFVMGLTSLAASTAEEETTGPSVPLPSSAHTEASSLPLASGTDGKYEVQVLNMDSGKQKDVWGTGAIQSGPPSGEIAVDSSRKITAFDLGENTIFIPQLGIYAPVVTSPKSTAPTSGGFEQMRLVINPRKVALQRGTAPITNAGNKGVSLIGGFVSYAGQRGALYDLGQIEIGNSIWTRGVDTKEADRVIQRWMVREISVIDAGATLPKAYWSAKGDRRLVLVTSGGDYSGGEHGRYAKTVVVVAWPMEYMSGH